MNILIPNAAAAILTDYITQGASLSDTRQALHEAGHTISPHHLRAWLAQHPALLEKRAQNFIDGSKTLMRGIATNKLAEAALVEGLLSLQHDPKALQAAIRASNQAESLKIKRQHLNLRRRAQRDATRISHFRIQELQARLADREATLQGVRCALQAQQAADNAPKPDLQTIVNRALRCMGLLPPEIT